MLPKNESSGNNFGSFNGNDNFTKFKSNNVAKIDRMGFKKYNVEKYLFLNKMIALRNGA